MVLYAKQASVFSIVIKSWSCKSKKAIDELQSGNTQIVIFVGDRASFGAEPQMRKKCWILKYFMFEVPQEWEDWRQIVFWLPWLLWLMKCWNCDILESWNPEMLKWRSLRILESWDPGTLESWNSGILTLWNPKIFCLGSRAGIIPQTNFSLWGSGGLNASER